MTDSDRLRAAVAEIPDVPQWVHDGALAWLARQLHGEDAEGIAVVVGRPLTAAEQENVARAYRTGLATVDEILIQENITAWTRPL